MHIIGLACVNTTCLCLLPNMICFRQKVERTAELLDKVKSLSFSWMEAHNECLVFDINDW